MSSKIDVLLVNPWGTEQDGYTNPPLGLLYLAGTLLKHNFTVDVVDCCVDGEDALRQKLVLLHPKIVGVTCLTPARHRALEVAEQVKMFDRNIQVVFGGAHSTIMHRQLLENYSFIDCVVLGEGEYTFLEIVEGRAFCDINGLAYRGSVGVVVTTSARQYVKNLDDLAFPAWHLIDFSKYPAIGEGVVNGVDLAVEPRVSVVFSRGCVGHCNFCSTWWIWRGYRHRSALNMVDELELLYLRGVRSFCFADDAFTVNQTEVMWVCDEILRRGLKIAFHVTTRVDCVSEEFLQN